MHVALSKTRAIISKREMAEHLVRLQNPHDYNRRESTSHKVAFYHSVTRS